MTTSEFEKETKSIEDCLPHVMGATQSGAGTVAVVRSILLVANALFDAVCELRALNKGGIEVWNHD